jgi:hypothetical protein
MRVKIIVARSAYPVVGKIIDIEKSQAQYLVDVGLAELASKESKKRQSKSKKRMLEEDEPIIIED